MLETEALNDAVLRAFFDRKVYSDQVECRRQASLDANKKLVLPVIEQKELTRKEKVFAEAGVC